MCYVQGRTDPTQFFYNLTLSFDEHPDLAALKGAIEQRLNEDNIAGEGSDFIVSDIEILDFRLNQWVNVERRSQLYSGCSLCAIRDISTGSSSGAVDRSNTIEIRRVLGFALDAQRLFDALDSEGTGFIRLKNMLRVLRHDVEYAVDAFSTLDAFNDGEVSFQSLLSLFNQPEHQTFFQELKNRIAQGGQRVEGRILSSVPIKLEPAHSIGEFKLADVPKPNVVVPLMSMSPALSATPNAAASTTAMSERSFGGDASEMSPTEAKKMQLVLEALQKRKGKTVPQKEEASHLFPVVVEAPQLSPGVVTKLKGLRKKKESSGAS